jgi:pyrophosphatase PpaX
VLPPGVPQGAAGSAAPATTRPPQKGEPVASESPPSVVLFDVDGTLIDTFHLYLEAYRRALEPILGHRPALEEFAQRRPASERFFLREWIGAERLEECHASMCDHYEELHGTLGEGLYEGVREMLAALRSAGIPLGVVTGKGRHAWRVSSAALGLEDLFEAVVVEDDVEHPKPDPGGVLAALRALGARPEQALYVGDSASDLDAGRRAGTRIAAALWPKTGPGERESFLEQIAPFAPDWTFDRPADLTRALAPWC